MVTLVVAPTESVEEWCQRRGFTFPMLADADHKVSEAYGVYNLLGDGLAAPAAFVVEIDGRITWSQVSWHPGEWPSAQAILEHLP